MPSPTPFSYTVAAGDTCLVIAARFEISVASIVRLNNLPAACTIFPNDELLIPYPTPTPTSFPTATLSGIEATRAACDSVSYTVEDGDTLSGLAETYYGEKWRWPAIYEANIDNIGDDPNFIQPPAELTIP